MRPNHPCIVRRIARASVVAVGLLLGADLRAAVPLALPAGEDPAQWQSAARLAGFSLEAAGAGPSVSMVDLGESWEIRVRDATGSERRVPVAEPHTAREREDLLWVAASLAVPLESAAPRVAAPSPLSVITGGAAPVSPGARPPDSTARPASGGGTGGATRSTAAPRAKTGTAAPAPAPAAATSPAAAPPVSAPTSEASPWSAPAASPTAPAEDPGKTGLPAQPGSLAVAPRVALLGGLGAGGAVEVDRLGSFGGRGELLLAAELAGRARAGLSLGALTPNALEPLGADEGFHRLDAALELGLRLPGAWSPALAARAGLGWWRFTEGDPAELVGALRVPFLGGRGELARPLGAGFSVLASAGLDRDLAAARADKEGVDTSITLPRTRVGLLVGFSWSP